MTPKQFLRLHPKKYVMVTYEFGDPIYVAPLKNLNIQVTKSKDEAEIWSEMDNTPTKLEYYKVATGFQRLSFEHVELE